MSTITAILKLNTKTAAEWTAANPVLAKGEVGYESDTTYSKLGDGSSTWNNLPYNTVSNVVGYLPLTAGSSNPLSGSLYINRTGSTDRTILEYRAPTSMSSSFTINVGTTSSYTPYHFDTNDFFVGRGGNILPNLGTSTYAWGTLYAHNMRCGSTSNYISFGSSDGQDTIYNNGNPSANASHKFRIGAGDKFVISGTANTSYNSILSNDVGALDIGSETNPFRHIYSNSTRYQDSRNLNTRWEFNAHAIGGTNIYFDLVRNVKSGSTWTGYQILKITPNHLISVYDSNGVEEFQFTSQTDGNVVFKKLNSGTSTAARRFTFVNISAGVYLATAATAWASNSDRRKKKGIVELENSLDKLLQLAPVRYALDDDNTDNPTRVGLIAQEVQPLFPEVVEGRETATEYLGIAYSEFIPFIIKSIQELSKKIDDLKKELGLDVD